MELWQNIDYSSGISYLVNTPIYELDLSKANINVLYEAGVINDELYNFLYSAERDIRQRYIGNLERSNHEITKIKQAGIIEAKRKLFTDNNLQPYEILSIRNDAVFVIGRVPTIRQWGRLEFKVKSSYTGFYSLPLNNLEFLYYYSSVTEQEILDVKGVSKTLHYHTEFFYQFLKDLFYTIQVDGIAIAMRLMKGFYEQYVKRELPTGYYRTFDPTSRFVFSPRTSMNTYFRTDTVLDDQKQYLNISCNLRLLIELQKLLHSMYFDH